MNNTELIADLQSNIVGDPFPLMRKAADAIHEALAFSGCSVCKQAQPERAPLSCTWTQEDDFDMPGVYHTSCGEMWSFIEGGIKENNTKFCPHCGGGIKQGGQQ